MNIHAFDTVTKRDLPILVASTCDQSGCDEPPTMLLLLRNDAGFPRYRLTFACDEHGGARAIFSAQRLEETAWPKGHPAITKSILVTQGQRFTIDDLEGLVP